MARDATIVVSLEGQFRLDNQRAFDQAVKLARRHPGGRLIALACRPDVQRLRRPHQSRLAAEALASLRNRLAAVLAAHRSPEPPLGPADPRSAFPFNGDEPTALARLQHDLFDTGGLRVLVEVLPIPGRWIPIGAADLAGAAPLSESAWRRRGLGVDEAGTALARVLSLVRAAPRRRLPRPRLHPGARPAIH